MASDQTNESQFASTTAKVGVASNTEVDVNVTKNSSFTQYGNKEEVINEIVKTLTPMVTNFLANAARVVGKAVYDIVEMIWNEWKEMSNFKKILVAITAAIIVGAVGTSVGYGAWHIIGGNWETIKNTSVYAMKSLGENSAILLKQLNSHVVVKKLQAPFENKSNANSAKMDDVKNLVMTGHGKVIMALLAGLPLFVMGINSLGVKKERRNSLKKD